MRDVAAAASAIGLQVDVVQASDSREIEFAFATLILNRADALLVGPSGSLSAGACSLPYWRRDMPFQSFITYANTRKPAG